MSVVGIVLIGLPLWQHFRVSLGTKGVSLEAAMKLSVLAEGYGENKALTRSSLESSLGQLHADSEASREAAARAAQQLSQNIQILEEVRNQIIELQQGMNASKTGPVKSAIDRTQEAIKVATGLREELNAYEAAAPMRPDETVQRQIQMMQRWQILQDTEAKIFSIQQAVTANKAAIQDKAYKQWDEYINQA
jgi:hypothetical protein